MNNIDIWNFERRVAVESSTLSSSSKPSSAATSLKRQRLEQTTQPSAMAKFIEALRHVSANIPVSILIQVFNEIYSILSAIDTFPSAEKFRKFLPQCSDILIIYHRQLATLLVASNINKHVVEATATGMSANTHGKLEFRHLICTLLFRFNIADKHNRYIHEWEAAQAAQLATPLPVAKSENNPFQSSVQHFVDDLVNWFENFVNMVLSVPYPTNSLPGLLEIDESSVDFSKIDGSVRMRLVTISMRVSSSTMYLRVVR